MKKIDYFVLDADTIAITGHIRPDGDCLGSTLGLYNYITANYPSKRVDLFLEKPGDKLGFLKNFDKINSDFKTDIQYDVMFCLDVSAADRLGDAESIFNAAGKRVVLDNHISNQGYGDENFVYGDSSSACEVLYGFLDESKMDRDVAMCLYTGIVSDTGVFRYSCTSPATMEIVAKLMKFDIPTEYIINESFFAVNYNENRILGAALLKSKLRSEGRIIYSWITYDEMNKFGVTSKGLESIVSQLKLTRNVECAAFFYQSGKNAFKVSLRSKGSLDVNEIASHFGGGGHAKAAGCNLNGELDTCMEAVFKLIEEKL